MTKRKNEMLEETGKTIRETFVEKELLQASVVQRELVSELRELGESLKTLDATLNLIKEHEFVEIHSNKWKIFAYQIFLGVLFAIGTVLGLVFLSWATYTFFKDSEVLRGVIDNQLRMRQFDLKDLRERAGKAAALSGAEKNETAEASSTGSSAAPLDATSKNPK